MDPVKSFALTLHIMGLIVFVIYALTAPDDQYGAVIVIGLLLIVSIVVTYKRF